MLDSLLFLTRLIFDAVFEDFDMDLISLVLRYILAFVICGFICIGLPNYFHPKAIVSALDLVMGHTLGSLEPAVVVEPVAPEPAQPSPSSHNVQGGAQGRLINSQDRRPLICTPVATLPRQVTTLPRQTTTGFNDYQRPSVVDRQYSIDSRDRLFSRTTPTNRWESQWNLSASLTPSPPNLVSAEPDLTHRPIIFLPVQPKRHARVSLAKTPTLVSENAAPSSTRLQTPLNAHPPPQPSITDALNLVLNHLHSNVTYPLALGPDGVRLPCDLMATHKFWNVTDNTTGISAGIIDKAGHLGQSILTLATTLRSHSFETLLSNHDGNYTKLTPPLESNFLDVRNPDNTHSSIVDRDSRLIKALELFASGDFINSVEAQPVTQVPARALPTYYDLSSTVIEPSMGYTSVSTANHIMGDVVTSVAGPAMEDIITSTVDLVTEDSIMDSISAPTVEESAMEDIRNDNPPVLPAITIVNMDIAPSSDPTTAASSTVEVLSAFAPAKTLASPFIHTGLTDSDKRMIFKTTPPPDTSDVFEGTCSVAYNGASGRERSGPLTLTVRRFIDAEQFVALNKPILNFERDDRSIASFTVVQWHPARRVNTDLPCFPFRLRQVGREDLQEDVDVTILSERDALEFCLQTGLTYPPKPSSPTIAPLPAASVPSAVTMPSTTPAPVSMPSGPSTSAAVTPSRNAPTLAHEYSSACSIIIPGSSIRPPKILYHRQMTAGSKTEWQYTLNAKAGKTKRNWVSILPDDSTWKYDGAMRMIELSGINISDISKPKKLSIKMTEAIGVMFCEWTGIRQVSEANKTPAKAIQSADSTSAPAATTSNAGKVASVTTSKPTTAAQDPSPPPSSSTTPTFVFGAPPSSYDGRDIKALRPSKRVKHGLK
ncbi:hypothetical protein FRB98_004827 [Tulasnella sp. 332]|nr:hypothetical protein FRB98_004827 [Tulasnella sp. 332]